MTINTSLPAKSISYGSSRSASSIKYLIYHYTGNTTDTAKANANYFSSSGSNTRSAGAHYFVDATSIYQSISDLKVAYAVGGSKQSTSNGAASMYGKITNSNSIHIEMCSTNGAISSATITNAVWLGQQLMSKYDIDIDHVYRHWDVNGKACMPINSTELLTPTGWVKLSDIQVGDIVATAIMDNRQIKWSPVLGLVEPYQSDTWLARDFEATANHRMLTYTYKNKVAPKVINWGELCGTTTNATAQNIRYIPTAGYMDGEGLPLTDNQIKFIVAVQADGHYSKTPELPEPYSIRFHFAKERKRDRLIELLDDLGYEYSYHVKKDGTYDIATQKDAYTFAEQWLNDKRFTWRLLDMSLEQKKVFLAETKLWDGCVEADCYTSSVQQNKDIVEAIAATSGVGFKDRECFVDYKNEFRSVANRGGQRTRANELVSCVTVESGFILVRQHGRSTVVGNCPGWSGWTGSSASKWTALKKKLDSSSSTTTLWKGVTTQKVNVREKASKDSDIIATMKQGANISVVAETTNWVQRKHGGWVAKKYVTKV